MIWRRTRAMKVKIQEFLAPATDKIVKKKYFPLTAVSQLVILWTGTYNKGTLVGSSSNVDTLPFWGLRGKEWVSKLVWLELRTKLLGSATALGDRLLHDKNTFWSYKDIPSRHAIGSLHWPEQTKAVVGVRQQKCIIWFNVSSHPVSCAICILYCKVPFYARVTFLKVMQIEHKIPI